MKKKTRIKYWNVALLIYIISNILALFTNGTITNIILGLGSIIIIASTISVMKGEF